MKKIIRQKDFMNTKITISIVKENQSTIEINDAFDAAFGEFDRIVKKYTRFNENSELSNLNRRGGEWTKVSDEFFFLINYMIEMAQKTDGAYDPTIIDFLEVYGYDKNYDFSKLDKPELNNLVEKIAKNRRSWKEIEMNEEKSEVKLGKGQKIDLGGIGKGYAIDCAFEKIKKISEDFLIDAGGDVRASGVNEKNELWKIGLRFLKDKKPMIEYAQLNNNAVASSGSWARKVKQFHHLINPQTGKPVEKEYTTVYVLADSAIEADAWATALFIDPSISINLKHMFV